MLDTSTATVSNSDNNNTPSSTTATINLLEWTNLTDPRHKLEHVLFKAKESIEYLNETLWSQFEIDYKLITNEAKNKQMKEIEGLTTRLSNLTLFLETCKSCIARQKEITDVS